VEAWHHRHGYHMPRTNARDLYYKKLEDERAARQG
jgi:cytochrome c oxidase subunit 7